jgi:putative hydrolase of the HAD superfamily
MHYPFPQGPLRDASPLPEALAQRFIGLDCWIFDLDNTLYPPHADLWPKIDQNITAYIAHLLGLDGLSARSLQKYYYQRYGTTLNGLMLEHAIDPYAFLDFVHDIDRSSLLVDPRLRQAIAGLPGRKFIFTNGSTRHAEATLQQLDCAGLFDAVFDIVAADFIPKPAYQPYERFLARYGIDPSRAVMFEDIAHNLAVPTAMGMRSVLVVPDARGDHKEDWERHAGHGGFDAITPDLPLFLSQLVASLPNTTGAKLSEPA